LKKYIFNIKEKTKLFQLPDNIKNTNINVYCIAMRKYFIYLLLIAWRLEPKILQNY